ncbi:MAG TPA: PP2C family protein-serine/threonine phosphatase [Solirubrobacteraceae bacterium]|nr:PP2C family protein-serine/threonine phosphatase [Solirubrobacteraceae bacterium]
MVNRVMLEQDFEGRFATAILVNMRLSGAEVAVTVASAGHPAALLTRNGGEASELGRQGALLGIFEEPAIAEASAVLQPGDSLALYTDGLLEAHAPDRTLTSEQIIEALQLRPPGAAQESIDALLDLVELDEQVRDDIAILSVRVLAHADGLRRLASAPPAHLTSAVADFESESELQHGRRAS